jgi:hypothetical protein
LSCGVFIDKWWIILYKYFDHDSSSPALSLKGIVVKENSNFERRRDEDA